MKKFPLLLLGLGMVLLPLAAQKVTVDVTMPEKAVAGEKIPVTVTIHKGDYSDFARFRQHLPGGFEAKPVETSNSDLTVKNGELNFIWLKVPSDSVVTLKYDLMTDPRLRGVFEITGSFSYILDQEREEMELPVKEVELLPPSGTEATAVTTATAAAGEAAGEEGEAVAGGGGQAPDRPMVVRGKPVKDPASDAWIIRLIVYRDTLKRLGRLEEIVPEGYLPENINGHGAIFSYRQGLVKYIWMKFPEEKVFEVSYKLVPLEGTPVTAVPQVSGSFSYMAGDEAQRTEVRPLEKEVPAAAGAATLYALMASATPAVAEAAAAPTPPAAPEPSAAPDRPAAASVAPTPPAAPATAATTHTSENRPGQPTEIIEQPPEKSEGIYFRVQILATTRPVETETYFREHHVPGRIYKEYSDGLYKYTTGRFTSYREARAFIDTLKATTDFDNAFVTAYDGDRRISVREALDRTGQKWFK